jgi:RNA polymerase sigma factor (sigma-70 family)
MERFLMCLDAGSDLQIDLEDLVEETLLQVFEIKIAGKNPIRSSGGVFGIAKNLYRREVNRVLRKLQRERERSLGACGGQQEPTTPQEVLADKELQKNLPECMRGLPLLWRKALILKLVDGRTLEQIGNELGFSKSTVDRWINEAIIRVRDCLRRKGYGPRHEGGEHAR